MEEIGTTDNQDTNFPPSIEWGVATRPIPGETESGDRHVVRRLIDVVLVGVVDGLGHGPDAATAGRIAVATLETYAGESVVSLMKRCHESLRHGRGAAVTLVSLSIRDNTLTWLSVGNVEGVLLRRDRMAGPARQYVVLRGGVVGEQMPSLHPEVLPVEKGDILVLATDGISHGFAERVNLSNPPQKIADDILLAFGKSTDDALVLVVRYLGAAR